MAQEWSTLAHAERSPAPARGRGRWLVAAGVIALALAVLGATQAGLGGLRGLSLTNATAPGDGAGAPDDAMPAVPAAHATAIADYWQEREAAFARGSTEGVTFVASRLHPALGYDPGGCLASWFPGGVPDKLRQQVTADLDSVAPAPEWRMPHGPLHDTELAAPVYRVEVRTVLTGLRSGVDVDRTVAVHLAVVDGSARGFAACVEPTVARTILDELAPAAEPTVGGQPIPAPPPAPPGASVDPRPVDPPRALPADPVVPPSPGEALTVDEELRAVLELMDALLQSGELTVAEAVDLLAELAAAPELDTAQRALVQENLRLLREADPNAAPPRLVLELGPTSEPSPAPQPQPPPASWKAALRIAEVTYDGCALADGSVTASYTIELAGATGYRLSAALHTADGDRHSGGLLADHDDPTVTEWAEVFSGSRARSFTVPSFDALVLEPIAGGELVVLELDDEHRTATGSDSCDLSG